jgi:hypothetical protein
LYFNQLNTSSFARLYHSLEAVFLRSMSKACQDKCLVFEVTSVSSNIWYIFIVCIRSYLHFTAKAVPRIHPVTLEPGRVGESVALNCSVSYDNDNFISYFTNIAVQNVNKVRACAQGWTSSLTVQESE